MPRTMRIKSKTGIYHILTRGFNLQDIFNDSEDRLAYLERLSKYKKEFGFKVYAYCLMSDHTHLLIDESGAQISDIMKKLNGSYAHWHSKKYNRVGHLLHDRFKSEPVEDGTYLLTLIRHIHQNPVKIGKEISEWTSYDDYLANAGVTDRAFVLSIFGENIPEAIERFKAYVAEANNDECLDVDGLRRMTDEEARAMMLEKWDISKGQQLQNYERGARNKILKTLKDEGASVRQIERLTGINRGTVLKA